KRHLVLGDWTPAPCSVAQGIDIYISDDCDEVWQQGTEEAILEYNNANTSIHMNLSSNEETADIVIRCEDFAEEGIWEFAAGLGEGPVEDGTIGRYVYLNTDYEDEGLECGPCLFRSIILHELGHNLGILHNEAAEGGFWATGEYTFNEDGTFSPSGSFTTAAWIEGTPLPGTIDPLSIFNGAGSCIDPICTFNENDLIALEALYPIPEDPCECPEYYEDEYQACACPEYEGFDFDITFNGPICFGDIVTFTILPNAGSDDLRVISWEVLSGGLDIMSTYDNSAIAEAFAPGRARICATVQDPCGNTKTRCTRVLIKSESQCGGDGDIPNPK
ncbi:MAG: M57 family metalloprotease, partial [Saprospiraceae bacterium]|nr:M57 family metalloprotease [Saprospiraceae bacterium]